MLQYSLLRCQILQRYTSSENATLRSPVRSETIVCRTMKRYKQLLKEHPPLLPSFLNWRPSKKLLNDQVVQALLITLKRNENNHAATDLFYVNIRPAIVLCALCYLIFHNPFLQSSFLCARSYALSLVSWASRRRRVRPLNKGEGRGLWWSVKDVAPLLAVLNNTYIEECVFVHKVSPPLQNPLLPPCLWETNGRNKRNLERRTFDRQRHEIYYMPPYFL